MAENEEKMIRIGFTQPEILALVGLTWNAIKSIQYPADLDWTTVRVFARVVKAAKDYRLDVSNEVPGDAVIRGGKL